MSARSEWLQFYRICRVQTEGQSHLLDRCNPRYRDEFSKFLFDGFDRLAWRAQWTTEHRMRWWKRCLQHRRLEKICRK